MIHRLMPIALIAAVSLPLHAQARGDFHWEKALASGNEVSLQNVNGDIKVVPSTNGRVSVVGIKRGRDADRLKVNVEETSHGAVVCVVYDDAGSTCNDRRDYRRGDHSWNDGSINLEVAVPDNVTVSAGSVSGDVSLTGTHGDVQAHTVSGNVRLDRLRATSVSAHSVSGDVDVHVDQFAGNGDLSFHTVSGNVSLSLPKQLDADVTMSSVSGGMDSDYPITIGAGNHRMSRHRIEARIGSGGRRLELRTVSGDVQLRMNK